MKRKVIFATGNEGKMREVRAILADLPVEVYSMKEAGLDPEIVEDGLTFEENAMIKACAVYEAALEEGEEALVLADDSGLVIDYLNGEPGVYSARYLGEDTPYEIKNQIIIERLAEAVGPERSARFVSVIGAVFPDGSQAAAEGIVEGLIGYEAKGENGFGYDPIFFLPEFGQTSAEISMEEKNKISHRGKALSAMKERIRAWLGAQA